jgi:carbamoyl-phosphate synthase large subunit
MNSDIRSVLILGSGALKIGQAGEFDYSGAQGLKALREEGIRTILINPNIATVQTSEGMADAIYFLPVDEDTVSRIIEKERPDGILLGFGGQTALNCGIALHRSGVLQQFGVKVLGTSVDSIVTTEDRQLFAAAMRSHEIPVARSGIARSVQEALDVTHEIGLPLILRTAFSLGGEGSGFCHRVGEVEAAAQLALARSGQLLLEESLLGWKEIEYEVVRDAAGNCITVCNMENVDPMGIHTGESIVVAPSQTLTDEEYHRLRSVSLRIAGLLEIVGECNVQFALNPQSGEYRVIEVNPRLSRSSALASKATAYPLAYVAAKLALGYDLTELRNRVTGHTSAFFEPALDYLVCKIPRWDLDKFYGVSRVLGSAMKSVGEVMAVGRTFEEALQKGLRMVGGGVHGLVGNRRPLADEPDLEAALRDATDKRIFALVRALEEGWPTQRLAELTHIDPWFIDRMARVVGLGQEIRQTQSLEDLAPDLFLESKRCGFSDYQLGKLLGLERDERGEAPMWQVRRHRKSLGILPRVRQIDTVAAEYPAATNYLYLTYSGDASDLSPQGQPPVIVLGSGPYRIGSSVEFDWCGVMALRSLRQQGVGSVMINCNPETASTDYDESDRLYFEELSRERVLDIIELENPRGVIPSMGGQTANNLVLPLSGQGVVFLGTRPDAIDCCEDRGRFSALLDELAIAQPRWTQADNPEGARVFANAVGFPLLVRPSYVLSGQAMRMVEDEKELEEALDAAGQVSGLHPVVISEFVTGAKEVEIDAVAVNGELVIYGICEHLEHAGVHSGDATLVFPPQRVFVETVRRIKRAAQKIAAHLKITGPFNIQFLAKDNQIQVIECNLRASRSFPLIAKALKQDLIDMAVRGMLGQKVEKASGSFFDLDYVVVKAAQFSFSRLGGVDPVTGVDMASTGEVGAFGADLDEALYWAMAAVGVHAPQKGVLLSSGCLGVDMHLMRCARLLNEMGVPLFAATDVARSLRLDGIEVGAVYREFGCGPSVFDLMDSGQVDLVIALSQVTGGRDLALRRSAIDHNIPLLTNPRLALSFVRALSRVRQRPPAIRSWQEYG